VLVLMIRRRARHETLVPGAAEGGISG